MGGISGETRWRQIRPIGRSEWRYHQSCSVFPLVQLLPSDNLHPIHYSSSNCFLPAEVCISLCDSMMIMFVSSMSLILSAAFTSPRPWAYQRSPCHEVGRSVRSWCTALSEDERHGDSSATCSCTEAWSISDSIASCSSLLVCT